MGREVVMVMGGGEEGGAGEGPVGREVVMVMGGGGCGKGGGDGNGGEGDLCEGRW